MQNTRWIYRILGVGLVMFAVGCSEAAKRSQPAMASNPPATQPAGSGQSQDEVIPPGSIHLINVEVSKVLQLYAELADAQLDTSELKVPTHVLISYKTTNRVTRSQAIRELDQVLLDQAGIVVSHPDPKHAVLRPRSSGDKK